MKLEELKERLRRLPVVGGLLEARYERSFAGDCFGCFRGRFKTFAEALRSAPSTKPTGFDIADFAQSDVYVGRNDIIQSYDYPVLFWLRTILGETRTLFDLGGNIGLQYYAYARYLAYTDLKWIVCEVPAVVERGRSVAAARSAKHLSFTSRFEDAEGADVLLAAGVLQFIEGPPLWQQLSSLRRPPRHLLLNKLPLHQGEPFVTLQNGGPHFIAQHVYNRSQFLRELAGAGYEPVDEWEDRVHSFHLPFHPECSFPFYTGLYLKKVR